MMIDPYQAIAGFRWTDAERAALARRGRKLPTVERMVFPLLPEWASHLDFLCFARSKHPDVKLVQGWVAHNLTVVDPKWIVRGEETGI